MTRLVASAVSARAGRDADGKANTTGYKGMTAAILAAGYDSGLLPNLSVLASKTNAKQYCLVDTEDTQTWSLLGPGNQDFVANAKCKQWAVRLLI